jgi:hypothetical protein
MRILLFVAIAALAGCGPTSDSTDIGGTYDGNATYTISPPAGAGEVSAGSASITITDNPGDIDVDLALAPGCQLAGGNDRLETIEYSKGGLLDFVFTSESFVDGASCALPVRDGTVTFTVVEGHMVALHGGTVTVELGGTISAASDPSAVGGYAVYQFSGAQP